MDQAQGQEHRNSDSMNRKTKDSETKIDDSIRHGTKKLKAYLENSRDA